MLGLFFFTEYISCMLINELWFEINKIELGIIILIFYDLDYFSYCIF